MEKETIEFDTEEVMNGELCFSMYSLMSILQDECFNLSHGTKRSMPTARVGTL